MKHLLLAFSILLLTACGGGGGGGSSAPPASPASANDPDPVWEYSAPADLSDGWAVSTLQDEGITASNITELMTRIVEDDLGVDGIAIARNGRLVLDELVRTELADNDTEAGNSNINLHAVYSVTKSVNATMVGIAIDQGHVSLENRVLDVFEQYVPVDNPDERKAQINLENFLTMRHGLEWDELSVPYSDPGNPLNAAVQNCTDYVECLLDLPMIADPGSVFAYSTHVSLALGAMVEQLSNSSYQDYIRDNLFEPLGIATYHWAPLTPTGRTPTGSGLYMTTRDMTKLGQLYLNGGSWNDTQVVSEDWISEASSQHVELAPGNYLRGYGYQWWTYDFTGRSSYAAVGFGGQYVIVIPDERLVVTFTSQNYGPNDDIALPQALLVEYIIPALR